MSIFFGFSDECGDYKAERDERFTSKNPFYVRGTLLIDGEEYKNLSRRIQSLRISMNLPAGEIKWSYLWSLLSYINTNKEITERQKFYFLRDVDYKTLIDYVNKCLSLLNQLNFCKIILTVTFNDSDNRFGIEHLYEMHLRSILQRVQLEIQNRASNLGVLFFDPVSEKKK